MLRDATDDATRASVGAAGGWFLGGLAVALASGENVARMFGGSTREQVMQLVAAVVGVALVM